MMQVNEDFSIDSDVYNWILCDSTPGKNGKRPASPRQTFHSSLEGALQAIVTRTGKDCPELSMVIRKIERCRNQICEAVKAVDIQKLRNAA